MAYEELEGSYQAAPGSGGAYDRLLRNIEDEFEQLQRYQDQLNRANDHGTPKPSEVHAATSAAKDGAACIANLRNQVGTELRRAASDASGQQKRERTEKQRELTKRFKTASKQFTQSVKATQGLSQRASDHAGGATAPRAGGPAGAQQEQEQQLLNSHAIDHQRAMFREREEEARRLAGEMATLQDIMGDLNQQVAVQGEMVDDIESNATAAEERADKGVEHLEKASAYQKVFTSRAMWLVAVLVILGGGVAAVVVLTQKK